MKIESLFEAIDPPSDAPAVASGVPSVTSRPRQWVIVIPTPCQWLTANFRGHHMAKYRIEKAWRGAAFTAARAMRPRLPTGVPLVRVDVLFRYGRKPVREVENLRPTLKNCVDGALGPPDGAAPGYGLVVDDSDKHLIYGSYRGERIVLPRGRAALNPCAGEVVLTVTALDASGGAL